MSEHQHCRKDNFLKCRRKGAVEHLLRWEGYPEYDNTWEPEQNHDCDELVAVYEEAQAQEKASVKT